MVRALIKYILLSVLLVHFATCRADTNLITGWSCLPRPENAINEAFTANLNDLLGILEQEGPQNKGFYKTTTGENSEKLYGLVQCRGDVSANDCTSCIKDSIQVAFNTCTNSNTTAIQSRWCFLRYSNEDFFGQWQGVIAGTGYGNVKTDDQTVVAKGRNLMSRLTVEVPNEALMFKTDVVDVGEAGKRYGLVQCNRDLSTLSCGQCLSTQLKFFNHYVGNETAYEVSSNGCKMWYNNYQFYFNITADIIKPSHRKLAR